MPHSVALVAFGGAQILDVTGPAEVFAGATRCGAGKDAYEVLLVTRDAGPVRCSGGLVLAESAALGQVRHADTVIMAGGPGVGTVTRDEDVVAWLVAQAAGGARIASVCTGAFVLAAAGLLAGRKAATHWQACSVLAASYPDIEVVPDAIHVCDGGVWTSAGVTAGVDLALALVEADHGSDVALSVARQLVVPLSRAGGQSQYTAPIVTGTSGREQIQDVVRWIQAHPGDDCSVPALARRATMSERHFQRVFTAELGRPPGKHVEQVRVELARRLLETTDATVLEIARACGFPAPETLHRAFRRRVGTTPLDYRGSFARAPR